MLILQPKSSKLSLQYANEARAEVLAFFDAPSDSDYTVIFTANASAALKLVGEAYPFTEGSSLVLGVDSHNSVSYHILDRSISNIGGTSTNTRPRCTVSGNTRVHMVGRWCTFHPHHMAASYP